MSLDYVLLDLVHGAKGWHAEEVLYEGEFIIAVGPIVPDGTHPPETAETNARDVQLLLERAYLLVADTERYKSLADAAGVRFFKVD